MANRFDPFETVLEYLKRMEVNLDVLEADAELCGNGLGRKMLELLIEEAETGSRRLGVTRNAI